MDTQADKARVLLGLHTGGRMLMLPNVWNPIGARILAAKGYPAVATASAAVSAALGYQDGEKLRRTTVIDLIGRIARSVAVPVTADIEAGYAATVEELRETAREVVESGVVGVNLEDSINEGGALRPVEEQCARLAAFRSAAEERGVPVVINARVDGFLSAVYPDKARAMEEVVARAKAYADAGADCIYPIGPGDEATVRALRERIAAPINILGMPGAAPLAVLEKIGVNRVSFGPFVFRACLAKFAEIADALRTSGDYACLAGMMAGSEAGKYLGSGRE